MDEQDVSAPTTLRDALEASFDQVEQAASADTPPPSEPVEVASASGRDSQGKFVSRETSNPSPVATTHDTPAVEPLARPTTWKKEYLPLWDKMAAGQPLSPDEAQKVLRYANQRETEYKTGVSTYKTEAENAKTLQEAMSPFLPELQKAGIHPAAWINNLGRAHQTLVQGSDQQRRDMFVKLASDYKVPLEWLTGEQSGNPQTAQQMAELNQLRQQVDSLSNWTENEKNSRLQAEIDKVRTNVDKFPHFEAVRGTMAQLLESNLAPDLETAYAKAVRMQDDVWSLEQERLLNNARADSQKATQVAKAKAAAVSIKSSTPTGQATGQSTKDRRSVLEASFDAHAGGRV